jgi:chaperonin GroEL
VALIASNGDQEVARLASEAVAAAGQDGTVSIEPSRSELSRVEATAGLRFNAGLRVENQVTDPGRGVCQLDDCLVLMAERKPYSVKAMVPLLDKVFQAGRPLLWLSGDDFDFDVLKLLIANQAAFRSACVQVPYYGDRRKAFLTDVASVVGGVALTDEQAVPWEKVEVANLGRAASVTVAKGTTTITGGGSSPARLLERASGVKAALAASENAYERQVLQERLAMLCGQVAVIRVGGRTPAEQARRKDAVEDAVGAAQAAVRGGVVKGGGLALLEASQGLPPGIMRSACGIPRKQLCRNAGQEVEVGPDVLDPLLVVKSSLLNALSIAVVVLDTEGVVYERP